MFRILVVAFAAGTLAQRPSGWGPPPVYGGNHHSWTLKNFSTLVAFGDSYTDDNRLNYFAQNNLQPPPVGWVDPANYHSADGGRPWVQYVAQYAGIELHNYAVSGAVCSNDITPRNVPGLDFLFPSVEQYEVPAWIADSNYTESNDMKFIQGGPEDTVYVIWIGTNDLGSYAFITDSQVEGTNLTSYMDCVFDQVKRVYDAGGRYFVLMNVAPLNLAPLYALPEAGGVVSNPGYWPTKPSNLTEISGRMMEQVVTVNAIYEYRTPFAARVAREFEGASLAVYDVHGLFTDIYYNPSEYLNGSAPLNVTGVVHRCDATGANCYTSDSPDSFMWYDDLHLSEQTARVVARNFVDVVKGMSKWATYW